MMWLIKAIWWKWDHLIPLLILVGMVFGWGVYPWLPSGLIIASDIEEGLYVLQPNYVRGAYLEGSIRDASNNQTKMG